MKPPYPSPVPTWRNDTYPAIDPSKPALSQAGKTIVITGAGSGIGRETSIAFSTAGAAHIVLLGRTESSLLETQKLIPNTTKTSIYPADVTNEARIQEIAKDVGIWDILILNAAHISPPGPIAQASIPEFWQDYEVNVKSVLIFAQSFIPTAAASNASIYGISSNASFLPAKLTVGLAGYMTSKIAQVKLMEYLAAENPQLFVCSVHPGMIDTKVFRASGATIEMGLPMDTVKLPAHFMVWLSSGRAKFLNGRFVWANWDVEELEGKAKEIEESADLTIGCHGWPFPYVG